MMRTRTGCMWIAALLGTLAADVAVGSVQVDTIGTTSLDAQSYGPVWQRVYYLPGTGIYAVWVKSGMYYSHFDCASGSWLGETGVFPERDISGNLAVGTDSASSCYRRAIISSRTDEPVLAVETSPGSGVFDCRSSAPTLAGHYYPPVAMGWDDVVHLLSLDPAERDTLLYSRSTDLGITWSQPVSVCGDAVPGRPSHSIACSPVSGKVAALWSHPDSVALWVNRSTDGGTTWSGPEDILSLSSSIPDARPGALGAFGLFDANDRLNVATQVWDSPGQHPAEIWHYQETRSPAWSLVHRFAPAAVLAQAEPQEPFVCRPSIGQGTDGRLLVAWMGYDSLNYEPGTQIARADLFVAHSADNGLTWSRPLRVTGPDSRSRISPCLAARARDTLVLICVEDQKAGIYEHGNGPQTDNSVVVLRVPFDELPGIADAPRVGAPRQPSVRPNPARTTACIEWPRAGGPWTAELRDCSGRRVSAIGPASGTTHLDVSRLPSGVYFLTPVSGSGPAADPVCGGRLVVSH